MDLNFEIFMAILLLISIIVVGNFLRDGECNYLEGALLVVSKFRSLLRSSPDVLMNSDRVSYHCSRCVVLSRSRCGDFEWPPRVD